MKNLVTSAFFSLISSLLVSAQFCGPGQEEIFRRCNGVEESVCIVRSNWTRECVNCWIVQYGPCSGQSGGGQMTFSFYGAAKDAAERGKNDGDNSCPWYNDQNYRIVLDDISTCPVLNANQSPVNMSSSGSGVGGHTGNDNWDDTNTPSDTQRRDTVSITIKQPNTNDQRDNNNEYDADNTSIDWEAIIKQAKEEYTREYYRLTGQQLTASQLAEWESIFRSVIRNGDLDPETILSTYGGSASKTQKVDLPTFDSPTIKTFGPNYSGAEKGSGTNGQYPPSNGNLGNGNGMYEDKPYTDPGPYIPGKKP